MTDSPFPHRPGDTGTSWAVVQANDRATRYARTGRGRAVVLLHDAPATLAATVSHLAATHRVIAPEVPRQRGQFAAWFGDFLDGIGVAHCAVIAAAPHAADAVATVLQDPERYSHLALFFDGSPREAEEMAGRLSAIGNGPQIPLLLLPASAGEEETASRLLAFLAAATATGA